MFINKQQIPTVDTDGSFTYLGKEFNFLMSDVGIKEKMTTFIEDTIHKIYTLPVRSLDKIKIVNSYLYSKIKWPMSIYRLGVRWIKQNCDNVVTRQTRHWLNLHPGANFTHLKLPGKNLGLNFKLPTDIYKYCQVTTRRIMSSSKDPDIRKLYLASSSSNVVSDEIVEQAKASRNKNQKKQAKDLQTKQIMQSTWSEFLQLKKENIIIKFLTDNVSLTRITSWQKSC